MTSGCNGRVGSVRTKLSLAVVSGGPHQGVRGYCSLFGVLVDAASEASRTSGRAV